MQWHVLQHTHLEGCHGLGDRHGVSAKEQKTGSCEVLDMGWKGADLIYGEEELKVPQVCRVFSWARS